MQEKKKLLICIDWFEPAYKAGGPIQSVKNLVLSLQDYYDIFLLTGDRDLGDTAAMPGIVPDQWTNFNNRIKVLYASPASQSYKGLKKIISAIAPDVVYLNSMFSKAFSFYPLLLARFGTIKCPVVLAPKGMLRPSALAFKPIKKKIFLAAFKILSIPKMVSFHATDQEEEKNIRDTFGSVRVTCILDSPAPLPAQTFPVKKEPGKLNLLFIGRVHPIKGLDFLLRQLAEVAGEIKLTVVGLQEDKHFLAQCRSIVAGFPPSITVEFAGDKAHAEIASIIKSHHLLALPTRGENFGHAIYECLGAGRPVLISDQTIWKGLTEYKAGWDLPLNDPAAFVSSTRAALAWDQQTYDQWSSGARRFAEDYLAHAELNKAYQKLFN